jgi:hypothetical protein
MVATVSDVQARMLRTLNADEKALAAQLLGDACVMIRAAAPNADAQAAKVVACRMVIRALGDGETGGYPVGATQGSRSALGYTESFTISGGGGTGELYVSKSDRKLLGLGSAIGSYSPAQELVCK